MILNPYLINTKNDIIQLKKDLMTEGTKDTEENKNNIYNDKKSIISDVKSIIKSELGIKFEENIHGTLKYEYLLEESDFPRNVFYRIVKIGADSFPIISSEKKQLLIKGKYYIFQINNNYSISITDKNKPSIINIVKDYDNEVFFSINSVTISVLPHNDLEVDGIFSIKNKFHAEMFNHNEVEVIFNNIKKNEEDKFQFAILVIKLNPKDLSDLIFQIKRDESFFGNVTKEKIVYIGFVGKGDINKKINFKDLFHIKTIIYSIKNNELCYRNLVRSIDWITVGKVNQLNEKINKLTEKVNIIEYKLDMIINYLGINTFETRKNKLGKKRNRTTEDE